MVEVEEVEEEEEEVVVVVVKVELGMVVDGAAVLFVVPLLDSAAANKSEANMGCAAGAARLRAEGCPQSPTKDQPPSSEEEGKKLDSLAALPKRETKLPMEELRAKPMLGAPLAN